MRRLSGRIYLQDNKLYRPVGFWTQAVHLLLIHLKNKQFYTAPEVLGIDNNHEILSYITGDVYNYPLKGSITSQEALCSAAVLLCSYHKATISFLQNNQSKDLK